MTLNLVLVERTPQQSTSPTLTEVGPIEGAPIVWSHVLNGPGRLTATFQPDRADADVRDLLAELIYSTQPPGVEARLYNNSTIEWAGPLVGGDTSPAQATVQAASLEHYLYSMGLDDDLTFTATDEHLIVRDLVDQWQDLDYANFGIDTTTIAAGGTARDRTYLASEQPTVFELVDNLANVDGGFDWYVDPTDRGLYTVSSRGSWLADESPVGPRNIRDGRLGWSCHPDDLAGEVRAVSIPDTDGPVLTATAENPLVIGSWGRTFAALRVDRISVQATLDSHARRYADDRNDTYVDVESDLVPVTDVQVGDLEPGDVIEVDFDHGFGRRQLTRMLLAVEHSSDRDGKTSTRLTVA